MFCEETSPTYFPSIQTDMEIISLYEKRSLFGQFNVFKFKVKA